jgi:hypothetical protein
MVDSARDPDDATDGDATASMSRGESMPAALRLQVFPSWGAFSVIASSGGAVVRD